MGKITLTLKWGSLIHVGFTQREISSELTNISNSSLEEYIKEEEISKTKSNEL